MAAEYDVFVIGGGINGCGIARDAAGRGYSVCLCERDDLASGTSSASTKLVHGGLRYLEYYEFRLVREALQEREVLWALAPHIIRPLRFVLPHHAGLRPAWLLRLGLFIYDHLGGRRRLPPARTLDLAADPAGRPLKALYRRAFEYSDCWVDDARLVVLNARDAANRGATIETRTVLVGARRENGLWRLTVQQATTGARREITARFLVNASGPWVDRVLEAVRGDGSVHNVRLVQGSHIVVRRLFEHDRCYIFQNADGRIVFAIPYERDFTLIGTTDRDYEGDPGSVAISEEEVDYLCRAASEYFARGVARSDVVWAYSGVRPLYDDGASKAQEATRDYVLALEGGRDEPGLLNVFGGKITTYRRLAEAAVAKINEAFGEARPAWTAHAPLPGGDLPVDGVGDLVDELARAAPGLERALVERLVRQYGTHARQLLEGVREPGDLGQAFGAGLSEREVDYLIANEWAMTAEDVVWRRTKLGLRMSGQEIAALERHMRAHGGTRLAHAASQAAAR